MPEPNFSESLLQSATNSAYTRAAFEVHQAWLMAHVPSLHEEFDLGWDSAFYFPWLAQPPSAGDKGCNFFIQYKLSFSFVSPSAAEWQDWRTTYFRFKIPHNRQNATTRKLFDDYHQWDRLKALADRGYPVFYVTNWTLDASEMESAFRSGVLLDRLPSLDVRTSFEAQARHFYERLRCLSLAQ